MYGVSESAKRLMLPIGKSPRFQNKQVYRTCLLCTRKHRRNKEIYARVTKGLYFCMGQEK